MRSKELSVELQDRIVSISGELYQKMSAALKDPKITMASIILKRKKFGITKTLPRAGCPAKLSNRGRRALVREVTKYPMVTLTEPQSYSVVMGEPSRMTTISASLHKSGLYGRVEATPLWKAYDSLLGVFQKAPKGLRPGETRFSGLMKPRWCLWPECQASRLEETWPSLW